MTPQEELEDAAAQLLDASRTEERARFGGAAVWVRFAEEGYFARLANAVRRVRGERDGDPQSAIEASMRVDRGV